MTSTGQTRGLWRRIADEPLAHFIAIGLAIFAVDRLTATEVADPKRIVVDETAYGQIVREFALTEGRAPSSEEMTRLSEQWVMNEALYREARALRLEDGDDMVRERIMQKLRVLMHSAVTVENPDDATLRAYLEENRALYDQPERLTFRLAQLDGTQAEAEALAQRLNAADRGERAPDTGRVNVFPFVERPRAGLEQVFGPELVAAIAAAPQDTWVPLETVRGWQAVRLEGVAAGASAEFEALRGTLAAEWKDLELRRTARRSVEALIASYRVEKDVYDPAAFGTDVAEAIEEAQGDGPPAL
jgi:hypothetical protein